MRKNTKKKTFPLHILTINRRLTYNVLLNRTRVSGVKLIEFLQYTGVMFSKTIVFRKKTLIT